MPFTIFLSVVVVLRNQAADAAEILAQTGATLSRLTADYELVVVDNASEDGNVAVLKSLAAAGGLPNLQVYALTKEVDSDTASWVGVESALGDFVAVFDPLTDDIGFLETMLEQSMGGADVVFASNRHKPRQSFAYRVCSRAFNFVYDSLSGVSLERDAPQYRVMNKRVVNFILQHPLPAMTYRHLPATGGFAKVNLAYAAEPRPGNTKNLGDSIERGMRLLVSTTRAPMRLVTVLSLFGAVSNLGYSVYVIAIAFFKADVAPGWVTLSLQQSGMFFLLSLVLLVLGEYILQMVRHRSEGPPYHVAQEFTSVVMTAREKLNVEEAPADPGPRRAGVEKSL